MALVLVRLTVESVQFFPFTNKDKVGNLDGLPEIIARLYLHKINVNRYDLQYHVRGGVTILHTQRLTDFLAVSQYASGLMPARSKTIYYKIKRTNCTLVSTSVSKSFF